MILQYDACVVGGLRKETILVYKAKQKFTRGLSQNQVMVEYGRALSPCSPPQTHLKIQKNIVSNLMSGNSFIPAFLGAALGVCAVLLMYGTPFKKDGHSSSISNSGSYKGVGRQADEAGLAPGSPRHSAELSRRASGRIDDSEDNEKTPDKVS